MQKFCRVHFPRADACMHLHSFHPTFLHTRCFLVAKTPQLFHQQYARLKNLSPLQVLRYVCREFGVSYTPVRQKRLDGARERKCATVRRIRGCAQCMQCVSLMEVWRGWRRFLSVHTCGTKNVVLCQGVSIFSTLCLDLDKNKNKSKVRFMVFRNFSIRQSCTFTKVFHLNQTYHMLPYHRFYDLRCLEPEVNLIFLKIVL